MDYKQTIAYLYEQLPAYQRIGKAAFKKDLSNIIALCNSLGHPERDFKSIHIAGTNGKGSCAHMIASIFQEAGYQTGLYTSPHLVDFRERIKVDGIYIHKNSVIQFVKKIKPLIKTLQPSFFEITVAMAFYSFSKQKVDIAIIETGLGGRLDSTNIIAPLLSVITNIGLEHQAILGNTLDEIAFEKAGIIKHQTPVVIGEYSKVTATVFKKVAKAHQSTIFFAEENFKVKSKELQSSYTSYSITDSYNDDIINLSSGLKGNYQSKNIITTLQTIAVINDLKDFKITHKAIHNGLKNVIKNTNFLGRWQQINSEPTVILDCAHNVDGIKEIVKHLSIEQYDKLHIIYGCVNDKDVQQIASLLPKKASYYITAPDVERAKPIEETKAAFLDQKFTIAFSSVNPKDCLKIAIENATKKDLILITGSVFLVSSFI